MPESPPFKKSDLSTIQAKKKQDELNENRENDEFNKKKQKALYGTKIDFQQSFIDAHN